MHYQNFLSSSSQLSLITTQKQKKINLLNLNHKEMRNFFVKIGEQPFRAEQVMKWIYHYGCDNFEKMSNLNITLRNKLIYLTEIIAPKVVSEKISQDGTIKWLFRIDEQMIETVYIPESNRVTLCISAQVGCFLNCKFCSTGQNGFSRNLYVSEIIGQIWQINKMIRESKINFQHKISNIVIMGMGEPLFNLNNVVKAITIMLDNLGFGLSKRKITISTSGIVPALNKLRGMIDVALAISLHAPNNNLRSTIMPINKKYNIESLLHATKLYINNSNANRGRVTIEYVMLHNVNDNVAHAHELANLLKTTPCKINLIPWNPFPGAVYQTSSQERINSFSKVLTKHGFTTIIRKTRGADINAACGQLVGKVT